MLSDAETAHRFGAGERASSASKKLEAMTPRSGGEEHRREVLQGQLAGGRERAPQDGDQQQRGMRARLTESGHLPMIARAAEAGGTSWPTTSWSLASGSRARAPRSLRSSPIRRIWSGSRRPACACASSARRRRWPPGPCSICASAWLGIPLPWRVYIREYDPPYRFVDVQVRGPWARWEHRHLFLAEGGGTWIEDRLTYRPPLGPLGRLAHALALERQVRALWAYRQRRLGELLVPVATPGPSR